MISHQYSTTLSNGIKLLINPMPGASTIDFRYYILSGSAYAPRGQFEISHLLEHLILLGNRRQPDPTKFASEMERYTSAWGGKTNRYLNTFWYQKSSRHFEEFLELATAQMLDPVVKDSAVHEQIEVISQELKKSSSNDSVLRFYMGHQSFLPDLFPDYSARVASLKKITSSDVRGYHKINYVTGNTAIAITGNIDLKKIKSIVASLDALLSSYPAGAGNKFSPHKPLIKNERVIEFAPNNRNLVYFNLSFDKPGRQLDDLSALKVLQALWGGGKGSRFYQRVRPAGLTYSPQTLALLEYETTRLALWDDIDPKNFIKFIKLAISELVELANGNFSDDELERAKLFRSEREVTAYPTPGQWVNAFGDDWALGLKRPTPAEIVAETDKVSREKIMGVARNYLSSWQLTTGNNHGSSAAELKAVVNDQLSKLR